MPPSPTPATPASGPPAPQARAETCERLRGLVRDALETSPKAAAFFADKLLSFAGDRVEDVALLARAFEASGAHRRAVHLLERHHLLGASRPDTLGHRLRAARCLSASGRRDEAVALLDDALPTDRDALLALAESLPHEAGASLHVVALLCVLRAQLSVAHEDNAGAAHWYRSALAVDPYAQEAWDALLTQHMLPAAEETALLKSLRFREGDEWLRALYAARLDRYEHSTPISQRFRELDVEHGLVDSLDVVSARADAHLHRLEPERALHLTTWLRQRDPFDHSCTLVHLCALARLGHKSDLYAAAHQLVDAQPEEAVSWFAVGLYYQAVGKHEVAARYYRKATGVDPHLSAAWIGFGNAMSAQDESDQAIATYRVAQRLFPGCHQPLLAMAMEHARLNNLPLACQFAEKALAVCASDPLCHNELGVLRYRQGRYEEALTSLHQALALSTHASNKLEEAWEPTLTNLAHAYRKVGDYSNSLLYFEKAVSVCPENASLHAGIGYSLQLLGQPDKAIEAYHRALAFQPEDSFSQEMLMRALQEAFASGPPSCASASASALRGADRSQFKRGYESSSLSAAEAWSSPSMEVRAGGLQFGDSLDLSASGLDASSAMNMSGGSFSLGESSGADDSGMSL